MKRIISAVLIFFVFVGFAFIASSCGGLSGSVTVQEWLEKKGEGKNFTVTVKVVEFINPYYARVEDETASVLLFGLWEGGEPKAFSEKGVDIGDTIVIKNPVYNVYEGNIEMKEAALVEKK